MRTNILHIDIAAPVDISDIVTFIIRSQVQNERLHELVLMAAYPLTFQVHDWSVSLWFPTGFKISAVDTDPVKPVQDLCSVGQELVVLNADFRHICLQISQLVLVSFYHKLLCFNLPFDCANLAVQESRHGINL